MTGTYEIQFADEFSKLTWLSQDLVCQTIEAHQRKPSSSLSEQKVKIYLEKGLITSKDKRLAHQAHTVIGNIIAQTGIPTDTPYTVDCSQKPISDVQALIDRNEKMIRLREEHNFELSEDNHTVLCRTEDNEIYMQRLLKQLRDSENE